MSPANKKRLIALGAVLVAGSALAFVAMGGIEDNLVDWGLDSIRLMLLRQRWIDRGADVPFAQLAERPQLTHWWSLLQAAQ